MTLEISPKPDTCIRVMMDVKGLDKASFCSRTNLRKTRKNRIYCSRMGRNGNKIDENKIRNSNYIFSTSLILNVIIVEIYRNEIKNLREKVCMDFFSFYGKITLARRRKWQKQKLYLYVMNVDMSQQSGLESAQLVTNGILFMKKKS